MSRDAVAAREEKDRRNALRRAAYRAGVGEFAGRRPVQLWDEPAPVAVPDTEFDDFLERNGW